MKVQFTATQRILVWAGMILAVCVLLGGTLRLIMRRTAWITLPGISADMEISVTDAVQGELSAPVQITPQTVQAALRTVPRSKFYRRTVTVTQFWNGGSGSYTSVITRPAPLNSIAVESNTFNNITAKNNTFNNTAIENNDWIQIDLNIAGGHVRHTLTDGQTSYIWYDEDSTRYRRIPAGTFSAENEQHIPDWETDVLSPDADITQTGYQMYSNTKCVYVETRRENYRNRYWINIETGLAEAAETLWNGEIIYRMEAADMDNESANAENSTLYTESTALTEDTDLTEDADTMNETDADT